MLHHQLAHHSDIHSKIDTRADIVFRININPIPCGGVGSDMTPSSFSYTAENYLFD